MLSYSPLSPIQWLKHSDHRALHLSLTYPQGRCLILEQDILAHIGMTWIQILGWPESFFVFFHEVLQKNLNEIFGQPNRTGLGGVTAILTSPPLLSPQIVKWIMLERESLESKVKRTGLKKQWCFALSRGQMGVKTPHFSRLLFLP